MAKLDRQLNLPPATVQNLSPLETSRKKVSATDLQAISEADRLAAELFDAALTHARISSTFVAVHLGVSESLVSRWRSPNYREQPSFSQMLRLPFSFQLGLHKAMNQRFGFGAAALRELLDAVGLVAAGMAR